MTTKMIIINDVRSWHNSHINNKNGMGWTLTIMRMSEIDSDEGRWSKRRFDAENDDNGEECYESEPSKKAA